jgi:hypothetical protein
VITVRQIENTTILTAGHSVFEGKSRLLVHEDCENNNLKVAKR